MAELAPVTRPFAAADGIDLPAGLSLRHLRRPADYPAMSRIANDARRAMGDPFTTSDEQMAAYYERSGSRFDADRDVVIAEIDGRVVGYGRIGTYQVVDGPEVTEIVAFFDPYADEARLLPRLIAVLEAHAGASAAAGGTAERVLQTEVTNLAPVREAVVRAAGYAPVRVFYMMVRPHLDDLPDAPMPEGLEIRDVRPEHMERIWEAAIEAFRDHWSFVEPTESDHEEFLTDPVESDTSLWRVAWDGDQVAGSVRSFINAAENARFGRQRGWVEHISVRRPYRRRGLARALIAASFPLLRARGMSEAALGVDTQNQSNALSVYERAGFVVQGHETTFRKPLD